MTLLDSNLNWAKWFDKWEAMQNCYIPERIYRFDLMLKLPNFPREMKVQVLDLCGGPGSLAFRTLKHYPNAHILVADADQVLLHIGEGVTRKNIENFIIFRISF